MDTLPLKTYVLYHGEIFYVTGREKLTGEESGASADGYAYDLWPKGMVRKWGNRCYSRYRVRRQSFETLGLANPKRTKVLHYEKFGLKPVIDHVAVRDL